MYSHIYVYIHMSIYIHIYFVCLYDTLYVKYIYIIYQNWNNTKYTV